MATVLVTGGTGFIGGHLVLRLVRDRHRVTVISRFGAREAVGGVTYRKGFFGDDAVLNGLGGPFDGVYHLAASIGDDTQMRAVNVEATRALGRWAAGQGIPFFYFAGSIEAQGPSEDPQKKLTVLDPCRPVSAYGESKREAEEALVHSYGDSAGRLILARIGNVYGPGSPGFIRPFLSAALRESGRAADFSAMTRIRTQPLFVADLARLMVRSFEAGISGRFNYVGQTACSVAEWYRDARDLVCDDSTGGSAAAKERPANADSEISALAGYFSGDGRRCQRVYDESPLFERLGIGCRTPILRGTAETLSWLVARA